MPYLRIRRRGLGQTPLVSSLVAAITRQENTNPNYNNPCALTAGPGATGKAGNGLAIFPDLITGQSACARQIQLDIDRGESIADLTQRWAPTGCGAMCAGNDPVAYAQNLAAWTGLPADVPLSQLASAGASGSWNQSAGSADLATMDFSSLADQPWLPWAIGFGLAAVVLWKIVE